MDWVTASVGREPVRALRTSWEPARTGRRRASVDCGDVVSDLRVMVVTLVYVFVVLRAEQIIKCYSDLHSSVIGRYSL